MSERLVPRRDFLRAGSLLAVGPLLEGCAAATAAPAANVPSPVRQSAWDMSWLDRVTGKYRVVFNVTRIDGMGFGQGWNWLEGHVQAHGLTDAELNLVFVLRHEAVRMVLAEAMWTRIAASGASTEFRNELARVADRGAILLACNQALMGQAHALRQKESLEEADARAQVRAAVKPGVYVMPNGVFAVSRAQTAGCSYFQPG